MELIHDGRRREALPVLAEAVDLLERFLVNEASFYAFSLALTNAELGDLETAERIAARAQELADRSGDPKALADADIFRGIMLAMQGRHEEAIAIARRGGEHAESIGELMCMTMASLVVGENELAIKRTGPAIQWLERAHDLGGQCQANEAVRMTSVAFKVARAMAGEGPEALNGLDLLLEQTRAAGDPLQEATILLRRGQANATLPRGDRDSARTDAAAAVSILRRLEVEPMVRAAEELLQRIG